MSTERGIEEMVADLHRQYEGRRVLLKGEHPWAGCVARYVEFRDTFAGPRPVFKLEKDALTTEVFVMHAEDMEWIG